MNKIITAINLILSCLLTFLILHQYPQQKQIAVAQQQTQMSAGDIVVRQDADRTWVIDFPQHMIDIQDVSSSLAEPFVNISPQCDFETIWLSSSKLAIRPVSPLQKAHEYTLTLDNRMQALNGNLVPTDYSCSLGGLRPAVDHSSSHIGNAHNTDNSDNSNNDDNIMKIILHFNMDIDLNNIAQVISLEDQKSTEPEKFSLEIINKRSVALRLTQKYVSPCTKIVRIAKGLRSTLGPLRSDSESIHHIQFGSALTVRRHRVSTDGIDIRLNARLDTQSIQSSKKYISLSPHIQVQAHSSWRGIRYSGKFKAGEKYTLTLARGFPGSGKQRLSAEKRIHFSAASEDPAVHFADKGNMLSRQAIPQIRLNSINSSSCDLRIRPVYMDNYLFLSQNSNRLPKKMYGPAIHTTIPIINTPHTKVSTLFDLSPYITPDFPPVFEIAVKDSTDRHWYYQTKLIHISDIGISARCSSSEAWISCNSIADGTPLSGATVSIYNQQNQKLATGVCADDGIAMLTFNSAQKINNNFIIIANYKNDRNAVDSNNHKSSISSHSQSGAAYIAATHPYASYDAYIYCDRGVIRPGGALQANFIIRDYKMRALTQQSLEARLYDPQAKLQYHIPLQFNSSGMATLRHILARHQRTGSWTIELYDLENKRRVAQTKFMIESFIPERMHTKITATQWTLNQTNTCSSSTHWLEGGAASNKNATLHCRYDLKPLNIPAYNDYHFGPLQGTPPGAIKPIRSVSNTDGISTFTVPVLRTKNSWQQLSALLTVEVDDPSGRAVRSSQRITVSRDDVFLGIRASLNSNNNNNTASCDIVLIDSTSHKPVQQQQQLRLYVEQAEWTYQDGKWKRSFVSMHQQKIMCIDGQAQVDLSAINFKTYQAYRIRVECIDTYTISSECTLGNGYWNKPDYLKVSAQPSAIAGKSHRIDIETPATGAAILSIEGSRIYSAQRIELSAGKNSFDIQLPSDIYDPNVHCVISQHTAQRLNTASRNNSLSGSCSISRTIQTPLSIQIETENKIRPLQDLSVRIHAPDADHIYLALVDYGILNITQHAAADPHTYFHKRRKLDSIGIDGFLNLLQNVDYKRSSIPGGGGALDKDISSSNYLDTSIDPDVRIVAMSTDILEVDENGFIEYTFSLPDYEGKLRLTAIAVNTRQCSAQFQDIIVSDPIGLRIAVPTRLTPGDSGEIPITITNRLDKKHRLDTHYSIFLNDQIIKTDSFHNTLATQARQTVYIPIHAANSGTLRIECTTTVTQTSTLIARRSQNAFIPVQQPKQFIQESIPLMIDTKNAEQKIISLQDQWGNIEKLSISIHRNPLVHVTNEIQRLIRYPYGCLEQTTSRCNALLASKKSAAFFAAPLTTLTTDTGKENPEENALDGETLDEYINAGISRLHAMIIPSGGLAWWPNGRHISPYASLYASDFLLSAQEEGYNVSEQLRSHCLAYSQLILEKSDDIHLRSYAVYILSRAQKGVNHWLDSLERQAQEQEDLLYIALAYALNGDAQRARNILVKSQQLAKSVERTFYFRSTTRRTSLELALRLQLDASDPQTHILSELLRNDIINNWKSMHTNARAYAISGICDYFRSYASSLSAASQNTSLRIHTADGIKEYKSDAMHHITGLEKMLDNQLNQQLILSSNGPLYAVVHIQGTRNTHTQVNPFLNMSKKIIHLRSGNEARSFQVGETYRVELSIHSAHTIEHLAISDIVPAGFEALPQRLASTLTSIKQQRLKHISSDIRDDRVNTFISQKFSGSYTISYLMRATFKGTFNDYGVHAEAMYNPLQQADLSNASPIIIH